MTTDNDYRYRSYDTYRDLAWTWMTGGGTDSEESQRRYFAANSLEYIADECIRAWDEQPDKLDRAALIKAFAAHRDWLAEHSDED